MLAEIMYSTDLSIFPISDIQGLKSEWKPCMGVLCLIMYKMSYGMYINDEVLLVKLLRKANICSSNQN